MRAGRAGAPAPAVPCANAPRVGEARAGRCRLVASASRRQAHGDQKGTFWMRLVTDGSRGVRAPGSRFRFNQGRTLFFTGGPKPRGSRSEYGIPVVKWRKGLTTFRLGCAGGGGGGELILVQQAGHMTFRGPPELEKCNLDKNGRDTPSPRDTPQGEGARGSWPVLSAGRGMGRG